MRTTTVVSAESGSLSLSVLGLGCSQFGSFGNAATDAQARATLEAALDLGVTVFDTADIYGQGDSERMIGRALAGRRAEAFVVTKLGNRFSWKMRALAPFKPVLKPLARSRGARRAIAERREGHLAKDFDPHRLARAFDSSLRRLRFDYVDGLLLHSPDVTAMRDPALCAMLADLKRSGKLRHFGVSVDDHETLAAATEMAGVSLVQVPLDVLNAAASSGVGACLAARGIAVMAREVIRSQPNLSPAAAVARAAARTDVATVVAGTTNPHHLEALARVCA